MAEIVDLAVERGQRQGRERACETPAGPAQVMLYTGIRYERTEPLTPTPKKKRKPRHKH
jgi:hypothetical protein